MTVILRPLLKCLNVCVFQVNPDYQDEGVDTKSEVSQTKVEVRHLTFLHFDPFIRCILVLFCVCIAKFSSFLLFWHCMIICHECMRYEVYVVYSSFGLTGACNCSGRFWLPVFSAPHLSMSSTHPHTVGSFFFLILSLSLYLNHTVEQMQLVPSTLEDFTQSSFILMRVMLHWYSFPLTPSTRARTNTDLLSHLTHSCAWSGLLT